jgi:hypothetical protein
LWAAGRAWPTAEKAPQSGQVASNHFCSNSQCGGPSLWYICPASALDSLTQHWVPAAPTTTSYRSLLQHKQHRCTPEWSAPREQQEYCCSYSQQFGPRQRICNHPSLSISPRPQPQHWHQPHRGCCRCCCQAPAALRAAACDCGGASCRPIPTCCITTDTADARCVRV